MIVISNEDVPFPTPWNTNDPAIPNGTNIKKKQNILSANAIWGVRYAVAAEYENSNAICGAKINVRAPKINEITKSKNFAVEAIKRRSIYRQPTFVQEEIEKLKEQK